MQYAYLFRENSIDWDAQNNAVLLKVDVRKVYKPFAAYYAGFYIGQLSKNGNNTNTSKLQYFQALQTVAQFNLTTPNVGDWFYPTPIFIEDNGKKRGWRYTLDNIAPLLPDITLDYLWTINTYGARPVLNITYARNPDVSSIYADGYYIITDITSPDFSPYYYTMTKVGSDGEAYQANRQSYSFKFNSYYLYMRPDFTTFPSVLNRLTIDTDTDQPWEVANNPSFTPAGESPIYLDYAVTNPPPSTVDSRINYPGYYIANKGW